MIGGTIRQSLGPLLAPCTYAVHANQLISLRHFKPTSSCPRTLARAASTLQAVQHKKHEPEEQRAAEFRSLGLSPELLVATQEHGLTQPTEIQVCIVCCTGFFCGLNVHTRRRRGGTLTFCDMCLLQAAAIPGMLQGGDVLLASHTGSGKTLAYLLPLVWTCSRDMAYSESHRQACVHLPQANKPLLMQHGL